MDLSVLNQPVTKSDIKSFQKANNDHSSRQNRYAIFGVLAIFIYFILSSLRSIDQITTIAFIIILIIFIITTVYVGILMPLAIGRRAAKVGFKVQRLARKNGWTYQSSTTIAKPNGTLFSVGQGLLLTNIVSAKTFEIGQLHFHTGSGRSQRNYNFGYLEIPLEKSLPHFFLDGKSNDTRAFGIDITNLPVNFTRDQIVSLEGDFNNYYTLYAPDGYGTDTRYVFTPDVMQALIQESEGIDVEILDNKVYVYFANSDMVTTAFWQKVERLQTLFAGKLADVSGHYDDDRSSDGSVAPQAMRLKRSVSTITIIIVIIYVLIELLRFTSLFENSR